MKVLVNASSFQVKACMCTSLILEFQQLTTSSREGQCLGRILSLESNLLTAMVLALPNDFILGFLLTWWPLLLCPLSNLSAGHGTHVAGIIGGQTYGVAKKVR